MTSLHATQICQRSKATRPEMSLLYERHTSKTKFAKLLTIPTRRWQHSRKPCLIPTLMHHRTTHKSMPIILNNCGTPETYHLALYMSLL